MQSSGAGSSLGSAFHSSRLLPAREQPFSSEGESRQHSPTQGQGTGAGGVSRSPPEPGTQRPAAAQLARDVCTSVHSYATLNVSLLKDKVSSELFRTHAGVSGSQTLPKVCRMLWVLWNKRDINYWVDASW